MQISLLRSAGIPARLAWNWLPGDPQPSFNHKIVEVWLKDFDWLIAEPLSGVSYNVGSTHARHIIFAQLGGNRHPFTTRWGDVLHYYENAKKGEEPKLSITLSPLNNNETITTRSIEEEPLRLKGLGSPAKDGMVE